VPLLIGSFQHFVAQDGHPSQDEEMMSFIETLIQQTKGKRVLCVASVDLAHMGPAFDDEFEMDNDQRIALEESDESLMAAVMAGDGERFYREIAAVQDANKICGFSPLYLMLRYLNGRGQAPLHGHRIAYQHCSADQLDHSLVSICGLLLD
jgi:AmmeMemoRadiSam system protein B